MSDGTHVSFISSADPLGTNPTHGCQVFSIDALGTDLRQLTHLGASSAEGCNCQMVCAPGSCGIGSNSEVDRGTGSIVFTSSCDPFSANPYGDQVFAVRPDGTGLRQLTFARGLREGVDGSLAVELPGPLAIPARFQ